jgi:hypothetical protein
MGKETFQSGQLGVSSLKLSEIHPLSNHGQMSCSTFFLVDRVRDVRLPTFETVPALGPHELPT